jgi:ADP-heptose:LPS heptosyltransferase
MRYSAGPRLQSKYKCGFYVIEEIKLTSNPYLLIGGDCGPVHGPAQGFPIEGYTELIGPILERADARFVNCMRAYSNRGVISEDAPQVCQPVEMASIFTSGLFDAVNMANNHAYDAGPDAFMDAAAAISCCNLVISSDTAIAHLAGALGATTWVALKHLPDWRWLRDRDDCPWYPGLRLFRQPSPGDWTAVFREMEVMLEGAMTSLRRRTP